MFRWLFGKEKLQIGDTVEFKFSVSTCDMFGRTNVIPRGTVGMITDKNVKNTVYDIRKIKNYEITHGNKERVLLSFKKANDALKVKIEAREVLT